MAKKRGVQSKRAKKTQTSYRNSRKKDNLIHLILREVQNIIKGFKRPNLKRKKPQTANHGGYVAVVQENRKAFFALTAAVLALMVGMTSMWRYTFVVKQFTFKQPDRSAEIALEVPVLQTEASVQADTTGQPVDYLAVDSQVLSMRQVSSYLKVPPLFDAPVRSYLLKVNGEVLGYFDNAATPQALLTTLINEKLTENSEVIEVGFAENVQIVEENVSLYDFPGFSDVGMVQEFVQLGTNEKKTYTVKSGDVVGLIALNHKMSEAEFYEANPGLKTQKYLQIGQEVSVIVPKPRINVQTKERVTYTEAVNYEVAYENNSNLYKGETAIKVRGSKGEQTVTKEVVKINGVEVEHTVIETVLTKQPETRIVYQGTKPAPPKIGTGSFSVPLSRSYTVSSKFGMRWGRQHTGIDLALPTGSPVIAADGGKVIFSGSNGTYGKLIIIDHGANLKTYYAHNSKLLVSKGDSVYKGQKISESGNSGRSTGPHLHFEVRVNNVPVNPEKYLKF